MVAFTAGQGGESRGIAGAVLVGLLSRRDVSFNEHETAEALALPDVHPYLALVIWL